MILLLQYTLIFASVLILVALGGCFAEHSGVINLGLEGIMIMGALGGALTMRYVPNTVPAIVMILAVIVVSALVGMVYSCLLAVASINFKADQTLVGTALNLLGTAGATVIGITDSKLSPLGSNCDHVLIAKSDMVSLVDSLVAPLSIVNALIVAVAAQKEKELSKTFANLERIWEEYDVYEKRVDG